MSHGRTRGLAVQVSDFKPILSAPSLFREAGSPLATIILGPLRLCGEYNRTDYWGPENTWRPRHQVRSGAEYWRALYVNDVQQAPNAIVVGDFNEDGKLD